MPGDGTTWILVGSGPTARRGWASARARYPAARVAAVNGAPEILGDGVPLDLYLTVERDATKFYRGSIRRARAAGVEAWVSERVRTSPFLDDGWPEARSLDHTFGPPELADLHTAAKRWRQVGAKRKFTSRRIDLTAGVYALWVLLETKRPERVVVVGFDGYANPAKADVNERNGEAIGRLTERYAATIVEWVGTPRNLHEGHPWRVMLAPLDGGDDAVPTGDYDADIARRLLWPPAPADRMGEDWILLGPGPTSREGYAAAVAAHPHALTFAVNAAYRLCPLPAAFAVWEVEALEGPKMNGVGGLRRPIDEMLDAGGTHVYTSERLRRRLRMPPRVHGIKPCWGPPALHDLHERRHDPAWGTAGARLNCGLYALWVLLEVYRPRAVHVVGFDGYAVGDCYADGLTILPTEPREAALVARNRFMADATRRLLEHYEAGAGGDRSAGPCVVWWGVPRHLRGDERVDAVIPLDGPRRGEYVPFAEAMATSSEPSLDGWTLDVEMDLSSLADAHTPEEFDDALRRIVAAQGAAVAREGHDG